MSKIQITLDATKLRNLVSKRTYQNKQGEQVEAQEVKFELVPMKVENQKVIFEKDNLSIVKTHFAVAIQTKEEREAKADTVYIGEGFTTVWNNEEKTAQVFNAVPVAQVEEEKDDLPF
jgi:hypothetical protein